MSDIDELQTRLSAAMERIARGVDTLNSNDGPDSAQLQTQLEEEKTVTAQLEERLKTLKERQANELETVRAQMVETRAKVDALDLELQRLRKSNTQLREANAALREANEAGVGEPHLINKSIVFIETV